jgi:hypothetical protein
MNLNISSRLISRFAAMVVVFTIATPPANAVDLGLTPSHVFSLWTNINEALVSSGTAFNDEGTLPQDIQKMSPKTFQGKTPGDVLNHASAFRSKLDQLRDKHALKTTPVYLDPEGGTVTPSVVFVNSGYMLDSVVLLLNRLDTEHLISRYFSRNEFKGKKPSDVYSLVDLANRRMDALLRAAN